jgi:hypothetical protein
MADNRPTWVLVLESAERLTDAGRSSFGLAELIAEVQRLDPSRGRGSIQPVVQGMTINAGKGPESPCGKVLERVQHGHYRLGGGLSPVPVSERADGPRRRVGRRTERTGIVEQDLRTRLDGLVAEFDACVEQYDRLVPFTRRGQYERHRQTINRRRAVGSAEAAATDDRFTELLHSTLQAWGIGRRASRLAALDEFRRELSDRAPELPQLDQLTLEDPSLEITEVTKVLDRLVQELGVVDNQARIVAGTKTLHHLLPDLVPPMDRAWTGAFFGWRLLDPQNRQTEIFSKAFAGLYGVAVAARPSRLVGAGWRTSLTKILDNAVIGYCQLHGIGGPARSG